MHFILGCFERNAAYDTGSLDSFCRTRFAVACHKTVVQNAIKRVLHTCETLRRVIVFVMYMEITVFDSITGFLRQKIVIDKRFCCLAGEFHHHSCGRVRVHVGVFPGDVVAFGFNYFQKHVAGLGTSGYAALIPVGDISFGHFFSRAVHQFQFNAILNLFNSHALVSRAADAVSYFLKKRFVFSHLGLQHRFSNGGFNFLFVISDNTAVALYYCLYHLLCSGFFMRFKNVAKLQKL